MGRKKPGFSEKTWFLNDRLGRLRKPLACATLPAWVDHVLQESSACLRVFQAYIVEAG